MARQLEENGIKLRAPEPEDLDCMFRFENIVDLWDISNTTGPYSRFHLKQYIEQTQNDLFTDRQLRLMIENSDRQVVGIVDICNFDPAQSGRGRQRHRRSTTEERNRQTGAISP